MSAPPPPPPHGEAPKTTAGSPPPGAGLGPGNYDIFVIPQRDKGGGFIYLPSLAPNGPSFAAGFACALVLVVMFQSMAPAFRAWWGTYQGMGNMGMTLLVIAVGVGAWAWGKSQNQGSSSSNGSNANYRPGPGGYGAGANFNGGYANTGPPPPPPPHGNQYNGPPPNSPPPNHGAGNGGPRSQWQERPQPPPPQEPETEPEPEPEPRKPDPPPKPKPDPSKGAWEKAREETKKREQERKAKEEEERRKAETARKLKEFREREARERARRDKEERERREKLEQEIREKEDLKQKLEKERQEKEKLQREKEKAEQEAKEAREREAKEAKEREARVAKEKETKEREEARKKEAAEAAARKARVEAQLEAFRKAKKEREEAEKAKKEREEAEKAKKLAEEEAARKAKEEADRKAKEAEEAEKNARKGSSYAYSSVGEKTSMWPNGRPPVPPTTASTPPRPPPSASSAPPRPPPSASSVPPRSAPSAASSSNTARQPPRPSARTVDEDQYSYRPYDKPKHRPASSVGSESSWAPSATTTRTTPPPSMRGPYTTKDPDKIVIKAVYLFMNQFAKTPASQLVSGFGTVTDGLILRITTEGLFIDDDVRGVPQREWDVKAWTLKLVEVWCPPHCLNSNAAPAPANSANHPSNLFQKMANQRARTADRGATRALTGDEADAYLTEMLRACKSCCRLGLCDTRFRDTNVASSTGQTGEWKTKSLHVLRATVRDQEGKRYMFVLDEEEAWKVAVGVQRLRKGTQVRSLGVSGMSASDARGTLETLGWS
ncbi:trans-sialidase-like protein [Colletotrichum incanum]|uniref:Trans-sialidase-like protein n=1 Tax=Colletotrichum incanum TaxID=1573173 RepID=A0A166M3K0_COLIC|nr:trans-sialidase-like protein [Colletotrichum incanum]OHW92161.1 trans-sialidase-like protein [Colletotrichum incanum]